MTTARLMREISHPGSASRCNTLSVSPKELEIIIQFERNFKRSILKTCRELKGEKQ